jgi:hypothetical protein
MIELRKKVKKKKRRLVLIQGVSLLIASVNEMHGHFYDIRDTPYAL